MSKHAAKGENPQSHPSTAPRPRARRLNLRALLILVVVGTLGLSAFFGWKTVLNSWQGSALLRQAEEQTKAQRPDLALKYLNRYLELNPDDVQALDRKAELLAESARSQAHVEEAIKWHEQVLRLIPDPGEGKDAYLDTRRRLAQLYLRMEQFVPRPLVKYQTAEVIANELIASQVKAKTPIEAGDYLILGRALEGRATPNTPEILDQAIEAYEKARELEPGDIASTERLARLYRTRDDNPARAERVLDALLKANGSAQTRLARHHYFAAVADQAPPGPDAEKLNARAAEELNEAVRLAPTDPEVLITACRDALQRKDPEAARARLAALPPNARESIQARILKGAIELQENHLDTAIENWRQGLLQAAGNDADLTWWLANVYLQLGRIEDARPLIVQFRRLAGGDESPPAARYLEAVQAFKTNQPAVAIPTLEAIRSRLPKQIQGQADFTLGQCYEAVRDSAKALDAYSRAARSSPQWSAPRLAAARLIQAGDPDAAASELTRSQVENPNDPNLLIALAQVRWQQQLRLPQDRRSWTEVEALLKRALELDPDSPRAVLAQADFLAGTNRLNAAVELLAHEIKGRGRKSPEVWAAYINGLSRQGKADEAMEAIDQANAADAAGDHVVLRVLRARLLTLRAEGRAAREALVQNIDRLPVEQRPLVWRALAELQVAQGDNTAAREAVVQWSRLAPNDPEPKLIALDLALAAGDEAAIRGQVDQLKLLGGPENLYHRVGLVHEMLWEIRNQELDPSTREDRLDDAEKAIREILADTPQQAAGHLLMGLVREQRGRIDDAISAYELALERGGQAARSRLANLLAKRGRPEDLQRIRELTISPEAADRALAEFSASAGNKEQARTLAAEFVQGNPHSLQARVWHARLLNTLGSPEEAEQSLRTLIQQQPKELGGWLALLFFQVGQGRTQDAQATVQQIERNVETDRPEFLWAQCYRIAKDMDKAKTLYQDALRKWPDDPSVRQGAADFYELIGQPALAEESIRHVIKTHPEARWATRKLALMLSNRPRELRAWNEAREVIELIRPEGSSPEDRLTRAIVYARGPEVEHRKKAIDLLDQLTQDAPLNTPIGTTGRALLVELLLRDDQTARAVQYAAMLAADNARPNANNLALYAEALFRDGQPDLAEKQVERLAILEPNSLRLLSLRVRLFQSRQRVPEAVALLETAYEDRAPTAVDEKEPLEILSLLNALGDQDATERMARQIATRWPKSAAAAALVLINRGKYAEAIEFIRIALDADGPTPLVMVAFERVIMNGRGAPWLDQAGSLLEKAVQSAPDNGALTMLLANLRHFQGRYEEEIRIYGDLLKRQPSDYLFLNNMAWTLSEELGKPEDALPHIEMAIQRVGGNYRHQLLDTRGVILTRLGQLDRAIEDLTVAAGRPSGVVYFHLARAYHEAKQDESFRKYSELAKKAGVDPNQLSSRDRADWDRLMK